MLQKKILQNIFYVKKSKCSKKAHLWLNLLSLLVHLIMKKKGRCVLIDVGFVANFIYFPLQILRNWDCTHLPSSLIKEESSIHFWGRKLKFVKWWHFISLWLILSWQHHQILLNLVDIRNLHLLGKVQSLWIHSTCICEVCRSSWCTKRKLRMFVLWIATPSVGSL